MQEKEKGVRCPWGGLRRIGMVFCIMLAAVLWEGGSSAPLPESVPATAAGQNDSPRIIGGMVPSLPRRPGPPKDPPAPFFLEWDFINGLFLVVLVLEFLIFPVLFWLWFGPEKKEEDSGEEEPPSDRYSRKKKQ